MIDHEKLNKKIREASNSFQSIDKLTHFLYLLMRDELSTGKVEEMVRESTNGSITYTNGWLAQYANYLSNELK